MYNKNALSYLLQFSRVAWSFGEIPSGTPDEDASRTENAPRSIGGSEVVYHSTTASYYLDKCDNKYCLCLSISNEESRLLF